MGQRCVLKSITVEQYKEEIEKTKREELAEKKSKYLSKTSYQRCKPTQLIKKRRF